MPANVSQPTVEQENALDLIAKIAHIRADVEALQVSQTRTMLRKALFKLSKALLTSG